MAVQSAEEIKSSIQDHLVESGEYEKLMNYLRQQLKESGWFDDVNDLALEELSGQENPNFERISNKLESRALVMVPDEIKVDMLRKIKSFLDDAIEKAP